MWNNIAILGMGRSGHSAAKLGLSKGMKVYCADSQPEKCPQIEGCSIHADLDFDISSIELLVVSPGVPSTHSLIQTALEKEIPVLGELAFASHFISLPLIAVTGTNGKSSTAWYTYQLLSQTEHKPFIGGNFGTPLSEMALHVENYTIGVVEVSSYQMEFPGEFHPRASCILNVTPDHLARHKTMDVYREMKKRIGAKQTKEDTIILPKDFPELAPSHEISTLYFDAHPGCIIKENCLELQTPNQTLNISTNNLAILGKHNLENIAAASLLCLSVNINLERLDYSQITALAHRLEHIPTADGFFWINDSKATNIEATQAALKSLPAPLIVLLGGAGKKGADYTQLQPWLKEKADLVLCFGASGAEIAAQLIQTQNAYELTICNTLQDAIERARVSATSNAKILLSPACASFDQFDNFEHRGQVFADIVSTPTKPPNPPSSILSQGARS